MRQLQALWYLVFTLFRKVFGLIWFWVVAGFREYARNTIQNYALQDNSTNIMRLNDRPVEMVTPDLYEIAPFHHSEGGYIRARHVTWIEFQLVYWFIWGWLDDDSNYDTFDKGHLETLVSDNKLPKFIINSLKETLKTLPLYGNTFDIGDLRAEHPSKVFSWATFLWLGRNTAYNFNYMQFDSSIQHFYYDYKYFQFGYKEVWPLDGKHYKLTIGFTRLERGQA